MATVLFPNQLFLEALVPGTNILLVEHPLFFSQLPFHVQKLAFHHVSMRAFRDCAVERGISCEIVPLSELEEDSLWKALQGRGVSRPTFYEPRDDFLSREIRAIAKRADCTVVPSPSFLTPLAEWLEWLGTRKTVRMQEFYQWQRKRLGVLVADGLPTGGDWSFDAENRKRLPKGVEVPPPYVPERSPELERYVAEAAERFAGSPGSGGVRYAITHAQAAAALDQFVTTKLAGFGDYEDAVSQRDPVLFHSQLSPLLNSGLLTPRQVLDAVLAQAVATEVPLNSLEGFVRQLIGWREYMALAYLTHGRRMRTANALGHRNPLPERFWQGTTGLLPVDRTVGLVLETGYAHHIERLMILGVFMLLTETEPTEAFNWFYAMFIDAYDWVMVPNVYAMSQYADGGTLTTKPYLCASAYLRKMADFPEGEWCGIWDGLYWRWVSRHQELLRKNPRTSMSVAMWNKFAPAKQAQHLERAEAFLTSYYA